MEKFNFIQNFKMMPYYYLNNSKLEARVDYFIESLKLGEIFLIESLKLGEIFLSDQYQRIIESKFKHHNIEIEPYVFKIKKIQKQVKRSRFNVFIVKRIGEEIYQEPVLNKELVFDLKHLHI